MEKKRAKKDDQTPVNTENRNRKRSNIISSLKRKNLSLITEIRQYLRTNNIPEDKHGHLSRLMKDASRCVNFSLYGYDSVENAIKYFASVFCGNKVCFVCNYARQKRIRRKYWNWFDLNSELYVIEKQGKKKVVTHNRYTDCFSSRGYSFIDTVKYDLMHLTLTVPHYRDTGFNGDQYYFQKIADLYHDLRNESAGWNQWVYGGEYGIETTRSDNGLHIHIHSLLFVRQGSQSRNKLHQIILKEWNKRTVNIHSKRTELTTELISRIRKSNRLLTDGFVKSLDPAGTTMINLETIYSWEDGEKRRVKEFNSKDFLKVILEVIKYHFEPLAFDKSSKTFDLELMSDIMPEIYRRQLYRKFGCLHGEKSLNVKEEGTLEEDFQDAMVNEDTGEIFNRYEYFICNPAHVYHLPDQDNRIVLSNQAKQKSKKIEAFSTSEAIHAMGQMVKASLYQNYKPKLQKND